MVLLYIFYSVVFQNARNTTEIFFLWILHVIFHVYIQIFFINLI